MLYKQSVDERNQSYPASWPLARVNIVASWRPVPALQRLLDRISFAWKRPSIIAVLDGPALRVGPIVVPGSGACYGCYEKRFLQHSTRQEVYRELQGHYDRHPESGAQGYLPSLVHIAALQLAQNSLRLDQEPESVAGQIWQMNTLTRYTSTTRVVGIHACPHCGLKRDGATLSYLDMQRELAALPGWAREDGLSQPVLQPTIEIADAPTLVSMNGDGGKTW